jgi:hypothetical protein
MSYDDDYYHPNNIQDNVSYFSDTENMDDNVTYYTEATTVVSGKGKKAYDAFKMIDRGYRKLKETRNNKKVNIEVYTTGYTPGTVIRDAVTGARYSGIFVGTREEDQFFKVKIITAGMGKEPGNLYFFTPDEFERHYKITLKSEVKEKWRLQFNQYQLRKKRENRD